MKSIIPAIVAGLIACCNVQAEKTVAQLIKDLAVQDEGNNTCNTACTILVGKKEESVAALRDSLQNENERVRYYAVRCLGEIDTKSARSALIDAFSNGVHDVRELAAYALSWHPQPDAEQVYIASLKGDNEWHARDAIRALGEIRSKAAVPFLTKIRDEPKGWLTYYAAFVSLRKISAEVPSPETQRALDFLREAKYSQDVDTQELAKAVSIINQNLPSVLPDVFDIFLWVTKGNEATVTPNAETILREAGPLAFPFIRIGLNDTDENVSRRTNQLVAEFGWREKMQ